MKGLSSIRDAAAVLKTLPTLNYIGYLEANELLTGKTDVLVCDGFTGNVTLKTMEGVVRMFLSLLKSQGEGKKVVVAAFIKALVTKSLSRRFSHLNPDQYNGACLLGLRGSVIKVMGLPISALLRRDRAGSAGRAAAGSSANCRSHGIFIPCRFRIA